MFVRTEDGGVRDGGAERHVRVVVKVYIVGVSDYIRDVKRNEKLGLGFGLTNNKMTSCERSSNVILLLN